jgi:hypothetical protein
VFVRAERHGPEASAAKAGVDAEIAELIRSTWSGRRDRGAETRLTERDRSAADSLDTLRRDPHLEMHTEAVNHSNSQRKSLEVLGSQRRELI